MKAWIVEQWCKPKEIELKDVETPAPGKGQVLVKVEAAAVNFFDVLQVQGKYQHRPPFPFSPGGEIAGTVESVGEGVDFKPGTRVMATTQGGYAEYALCPADSVWAIPDAMSFEHAAAFPIVYQTSYFGLVHRGRLQKGEWLLVHAGAGGVGSAAIQIGKALGAHIIATAGSEEKLAVCKELGGDQTVNYREEGWHEKVKEITGGHGADVIYDPVGGDVFDLSTKCIAFEGRLVVIGFASGRIPEIKANRILLKNIAIVGLHFGEYRNHKPQMVTDGMNALFKMYEEGTVRPLVSKTYPLADAKQAMADIAGRASTGKLILVP